MHKLSVLWAAVDREWFSAADRRCIYSTLAERGKGVFSANFVKRVADDTKSEVQVLKQEVVTGVLATRRVGHKRRKKKRDQGN